MVSPNKKFYLGTGLSSHQVEGNTNNNWSVWEKVSAARLAQESEKNLNWMPSWEKVKSQAQDPKNYISGDAVKHYEKFQEDFDIAKKLGTNAFRFSVEWSRIEPKRGEFDKKEIDYYVNYVLELKKRDLEPFVTLWHWTVPVWFEENGGWTAYNSSKLFLRFLEKIVPPLQKVGVKFWITLNEPLLLATFGYYTGVWPPQEKSFLKTSLATINLIRAHRKAYKYLKKLDQDSQVSVAHHTQFLEDPSNNYKENRYNFLHNYMFLDCIKSSLDFIGVNYYNHHTTLPRNFPTSDMGWTLDPNGLSFAVKKLFARYKKSIYITENGLADAEDIHRKWYLAEIARNLKELRESGVDLRGYFYWSLLDNFEWDKGFWPKFGLCEVDRFTNYSRKLRKSAYCFKELFGFD